MATTITGRKPGNPGLINPSPQLDRGINLTLPTMLDLALEAGDTLGLRQNTLDFLVPELRQYQADAARWLLGRRHGALFADPGTGKTLTLLTALRRIRLIDSRLNVLLVAPIRVMYHVWPAEIAKWGFNFSYSILHGAKKAIALNEDTDIHIINPEGLKWFSTQKLRRYNVFLLDESSLFRNPTSIRMLTIKGLLPLFKRRYILTGTPTPRSVHDLWSQIYFIDLGKTLGDCITHFRNRYFYHEVKNNVHYYHLIPGMDKVIWDLVAPLCYRIDAEKCLDLPDIVYNNVYVDMPPSAKKIYKGFERELFAEIKGKRRFARTAGSLYSMCRQIAGGALYREGSKEYDVLHKSKLQALDEIRKELNGKPILVIYQFDHELYRLLDYFSNPPVICGGVSEKKISNLLGKWNKGELPMLLVQSQSISHGVNMQSGGLDIVWYTLTNDYDVYDQLNRRVYRSGVRDSVRIHRLIASGTIDHAIAAALESKCDDQNGFFNALETYLYSKFSNSD